MATVTLRTLRRLVRERADDETLTPTTADVEDDPELDGYINQALAAFTDLLIEIQRHEWAPTARRVQVFKLETGKTSYSLFDEVYQVISPLRVTDGSRWGKVWPFDHDERGPLLDAESQGSIFGYFYRVTGRELEILPKPGSLYTIHVDYLPEFEPLRMPSHSFRCPYGWEMWPVWQAVTDILTKQERDIMQAQAKLAQHDRRIRAMAVRRAGKLRIIDRWPDRRMPAAAQIGITRTPRLYGES